MKPLVIIGAGGHGRVTLDCARMSQVEIAGFIDTEHPVGELIHEASVLGDNHLLDNDDFMRMHRFVVAIGNQQARKTLFRQIRQKEGELATVIHPRSIVSEQAKIGAGCVVVAGAVINSDAVIGDNCIINTAATIDHDVQLAEGVQICPGVNLAGAVTCDEYVFIGTGAVVIPNIHIAANARVKAGAVVLENIPA